MDQCTETEIQRMLPLVSAQRREQALRYKHLLGQFCCLKSWLMLQDLLDEPHKRLMEEWQYNGHGKPSFVPSPLQLCPPCFSISHCKEGIAVVVANEPIGIDIESIRHAEDDLIKRVMCAREQELIYSAVQPDRMFTRIWTQKEAVVKAQGVGIESFEQLQTLLDESLDHATTRLHTKTIEKANYIYTIAYG